MVSIDVSARLNTVYPALFIMLNTEKVASK